jgi:hypothetical protein
MTSCIRYISSFQYKPEEKPLYDEARKLARREGVSFSKLIMEALTEYVQKHSVGNPQTLLTPEESLPTLAPVERRRENLVWIRDIVDKNPGVNEVSLAARFAEESGLRLETVREYIQLLIRSHAIVKRGNALWPSSRSSS